MFETNRHSRMLSASAFAGVMLLFVGCASAPPAPTASLSDAKLAIELAERADASYHASAELDEARQKMQLADKAVTSQDMVMADRYAQQAKVMAELATVRTEAVKALAVNDELNRGAKALLEEMQRSGDKR